MSVDSLYLIMVLEEEETIETHQYASEKNESADCVVRRRLIFSLLATTNFTTKRVFIH